MIPVAEALRLLADESGALEPVDLPLERAHRHALAETIVADRDFPPKDHSAMDGFALRAADARPTGQVLEVVGEVRAGQPLGDLCVGAGQSVRIMTGAAVPPGADAVVMVERTVEQRDECRVKIDDEPSPGQHIRRRGEDQRCGCTVIEPGAPIHAAEIAALTSVGRTTVRVHRQPVVHVLTTGDEIVEPDRTPRDHEIRNSNAPTLLAQLTELGIAGRYLGIAADERNDLDRLVRRGLEGDLLLITGGVSAGKYDLVAEVLAAAGMRLVFHKVAVKPGKPLLFGRRGNCLVMGLPGNPISTYATFALFVVPVLRRLMGYRRWMNRPAAARMTEPLETAAGRETYHLARVEPGPDGWTARRLASPGSGDVLALARANGFVITPSEGVRLGVGARVRTLLWREFDVR